MIKGNVILHNIIWKKYLKNPNSFIDKKVNLINKKNKLYKKKFSYSRYYSQDQKKLKN